MHGNVAEPGDAGGLGGGGGVEAFGDGVGDDGLALLGEELDEPFLLADQLVDLGGFAVEEVSDASAFVVWRIGKRERLEIAEVSRLLVEVSECRGLLFKQRRN